MDKKTPSSEDFNRVVLQRIQILDVKSPRPIMVLLQCEAIIKGNQGRRRMD